MKLLQAAVDALVILALYDFVQGTGVLEGMSRIMRMLALGAVLFVAFATLNLFWARVTRR